MKSFYRFFFLSFIFPLGAYANCDFKTGEYISELNKPNKINEIFIKIPNSRKYSKDLLAYHLDASNPSRLILANRLELRPGDIIFIAPQPITNYNRALMQIFGAYAMTINPGSVATN